MLYRFAGLLMGLMVVIGTCYYETIRRRQRQEQQKLEAKQRDAIAAVAAAAAACCDSLDMTIPESGFHIFQFTINKNFWIQKIYI